MCTPFYILGSVLLISLLGTELSMAHLPPHYSKHICFGYLNMPRVTGFSYLEIESFGFGLLWVFVFKEFEIGYTVFLTEKSLEMLKVYLCPSNHLCRAKTNKTQERDIIE